MYLAQITDEGGFQVVLWAIMAGASVTVMSYMLLKQFLSLRKEARQFRQMGKTATSPVFKLLRPVSRWTAFFFGRISAQIEMASGRGAEQSFLLPPRIWMEKRLRSASYPEGVTADEMIGLVFIGSFLGLLIGLAANVRLNFGPSIIVFVFAGGVMPLIWLRGKIHERQESIRRGLPYALDLLTLSVEAGLDFTQALARIVKKLGNSALAIELGQTLRDIQLGRTRPQALRELGRRVDLPELNSIVSALIQADELGSSLGVILRVQADQMRIRRSQLAEKKAMEAPVKILLPLILFIFPTIFIIIFGPIVLRIMK